MLLFFVITAGAILVIYFYVVPQLESNLTSQKLDGLKQDATTYSKPLQDLMESDVPKARLDSLTRRIAEQTGHRRDSARDPEERARSGRTGTAVGHLRLARGAAKGRALARNVLEAAQPQGHHLHQVRRRAAARAGGEAAPLPWGSRPGWSSSRSRSATCRQRRPDPAPDPDRRSDRARGRADRGYYASGALTRRLKRLERAAGEVAAGNFSEPIQVDSEDELGQLARAFNEMQRRLARLDEARKEFIANASHELRTPIFSLGGFVELLEDEEIDEETRAEWFATMREQVDRLQKLTTELLDLSRLDAGSLELELEPVPLRTLAGQVAGEFAAAAAMQGAQIEVSRTATTAPEQRMWKRSATRSASPRSCASCSTTR